MAQLQETCTIDCLENQFFKLLLQPQIHQKWLVKSFSCMAPQKIPSQFLRNFNFLKREKATIFTCHNNCDEFNRLNTFEMGRKIFLRFPRLAFLEKSGYRTNGTVILFLWVARYGGDKMANFFHNSFDFSDETLSIKQKTFSLIITMPVVS